MIGIDTLAIAAALNRHEKAALYLSGGKDSLALLYVMRPWWDRLTVVWLDSGDAPRDTHALMEQVKAMVPNFTAVRANQPEVIARDGIPVDLHVPEMAGEFGQWMSQSNVKLQPRYECCSKVLWAPLHDFIVREGFTLLIRGQKASDPVRPNTRNGETYGRYELLFPLDAWSDMDVFDYLDSIGVEVLPHYDYGRSNIDCCTCPAYLHEFRRGEYLQDREPEKFDLYRRRIAVVSAVAESHILALAREVKECFDE